MYNPYKHYTLAVEVIERVECELCSREMNENENYYRGLNICPRCKEELDES